MPKKRLKTSIRDRTIVDLNSLNTFPSSLPSVSSPSEIRELFDIIKENAELTKEPLTQAIIRLLLYHYRHKEMNPFIADAFEDLREALEREDLDLSVFRAIELTLLLVQDELWEKIILGARAKAGQQRGGRKKKDRQGYLLAWKHLSETKQAGCPLTVSAFWKYFKKKHPSDRPFPVGDYEIYYEEGKLYQVTDGDRDHEIGVKKKTLYDIFSASIPDN